MDLYKRLKSEKLVLNEKEFTELVWLRQIKIDDERIVDPKIKLYPSKKYQVTIGLREVEV